MFSAYVFWTSYDSSGFSFYLTAHGELTCEVTKTNLSEVKYLFEISASHTFYDGAD